MDNGTSFTVGNMTNISAVADVPGLAPRSRGLPPLLIAFISLQQMVFICAVIGNTAVIVVFKSYIKPSITNRFIVNLAINDILAGMSAGSQIFYVFYRGLVSNMYTCFLRYQIIAVMTFASQFNVTFITIDRYLAICQNQKYLRLMTKKTSVAMILCAWIIPLLICSLPFIDFNKWHLSPECSFAHIFEEWYYLIPSSTIFTLMTISLVLYSLILQKAFSFMKRSLKSTHDPSSERRTNLQKSLRSAKVTATITIVFILCWAPYEVYHFKYGLGDPRDLASFDLSSWLVFLGIFNSMVNPFIYAFQRKDFRKGLKTLLCARAIQKERRNESGVTTDKKGTESYQMSEIKG